MAASAKVGDSRAALLVLQSLNAMFDVATERYAALRTHVPVAIFVLLVVMALACAFFAGIGMARRAVTRASCTWSSSQASWR